MIITNQYHLEVISRLVKHEKFFQRVPVFYIVERIRQMFPEYRDPEIRDQLVKQIDDLCFSLGH